MTVSRTDLAITAKLAELRQVFAGVERINPTCPHYLAIKQEIGTADDATVRAIAAARIPFVSATAITQMVRRNLT